VEQDDDRVAARYRIEAELAGRRFEAIALDLGLDEPLPEQAEILVAADLLGFAGLPMVAVPALPVAAHIAEKVHAYTRVYAGGRESTRVKDLVDLVLLRDVAEVRAGELRANLEEVFRRRGTHPLPKVVPPPPASWGVSYRQLARELGLDPTLAAGHRRAAAFLDPVLDGTAAADRDWNPTRGEWVR